MTTPVRLSMGTGLIDVRGACPRPGVVTLAAALVAGVVSLGWLSPLAAYDPVTFVAAASVGTTVVTTGVLLSFDGEQRGTGRILVAVGVVWLFSWSNEWRAGLLPLLSGVIGPLWYVFGAWALLRYPGRALDRRNEAVFLGLLGVWACGGALVRSVLGRPEWVDFQPDTAWFTVVDVPDRARWDVLTTAWFLGLGVGFVVLLGLLVAKLRRSGGLGRREALPPACAAAGIAVAGLAYVGVHLVPVSQQVEDLSLVVVAVAVATTPVTFLVVAVQRQAARAAVAELVVRLTTTSPGAAAVRNALRVAVGDPGLRLSYWLPTERRYDPVTDDHEETPPPDDRWQTEVLDADGEPLARLDLDPALRRQPDLVSAALGAAGLALANGRLHHRIQAQLGEVRASRQRIVTATRAERQRFERAVHDGAQGPLVAVSAALSTVRLQVAGQPEVLEAIERAQDNVRAALGDLRDIARGIHPMVLSEEGLRAALARLAEGLSVPTTIDVPDGRLPDEIESALYYTAAEALTNVVKHADATHARVTVRSEHGAARVEVDDDGRGGADLRGGTGLIGLRDRARALRGELSVGHGPRGGTRLVVTIPCA